MYDCLTLRLLLHWSWLLAHARLRDRRHVLVLTDHARHSLLQNLLGCPDHSWLYHASLGVENILLDAHLLTLLESHLRSLLRHHHSRLQLSWECLLTKHTGLDTHHRLYREHTSLGHT